MKHIIFEHICHAMLPNNPNQEENLLYVDSAVRHLYRKMVMHGGRADLVVKLFGEAQVLTKSDYDEGRKTLGEQNILQAEKFLRSLDCRLSKPISAERKGENSFFR